MTLRWQLALLLDRWAWALLRGDARATCRREGHFILDGDDYMRGYRDAQRHAVQDAAELRAALDGGSES